MYQSTKAGLERFSQGLHDELADKGIRTCVIRAGQMAGPGSSAEMDPVAAGRFFEATMKRGLNLMERGMTQYESATQIFRNVIDLPADLHVDTVHFHAKVPA